VSAATTRPCFDCGGPLANFYARRCRECDTRYRTERAAVSLPERFWPKVDRTPDCWLWLGTKGLDGYGRIYVGGRRHRRSIPAHRVAYELVVGPIPFGLTLDHLCRVHACVNPAHLEPVTIGENVLRGTAPTAINARKTHCAHGHPFDGANTRPLPNGRRKCRACHRGQEAARRLRAAA